ncbi:MAG TPA: bifunctional precorrin-2 dehydrogenase/sirohydrochlorin ferrochelatase [Candidatus Latescibacteria bacterium]|nr:bifunctional precorrin-2 dehydrogenase/sirohydrochlorin ferrochelatase [Candidatus Handelsmanbacteria bacterium]HIL09360.1 bifunctional precorrin-2 dehydrogenase/sirohydrochlorin ferrochelatase [Candidatus Latescibacterota bacterium]
MSHQLNPYFQAGLDVMDQPCLVIGGEREAEEKSGRLLNAGARITVVSPALTPTLAEWVTTGRITHHQRDFENTDLDGVFLALNTINDDEALTAKVYKLAIAQRILINSYDNPTHSNFGMMALIHPGHLRLSISTSNASPALASRLRKDLEGLFDEEFVDYLNCLADARQRVRDKVTNRETRFALLRALVRDFRVEGELHYPAQWRKYAEALLNCELDACGTEGRCEDCPLVSE